MGTFSSYLNSKSVGDSVKWALIARICLSVPLLPFAGLQIALQVVQLLISPAYRSSLPLTVTPTMVHFFVPHFPLETRPASSVCNCRVSNPLPPHHLYVTLSTPYGLWLVYLHHVDSIGNGRFPLGGFVFACGQLVPLLSSVLLV